LASSPHRLGRTVATLGLLVLVALAWWEVRAVFPPNATGAQFGLAVLAVCAVLGANYLVETAWRWWYTAGPGAGTGGKQGPGGRPPGRDA
jgi:hypothetical protein